MTVERIIELLEIEKECVLRNASGGCNRYCSRCDLFQDDTELHEMYTDAIELLKAQEPRVMTDTELEAIRKAPLILKPAVDAVPVEWLDAQIMGYASALKSTELKALVLVKQMWQKEQEKQDIEPKEG